MRTHHPLPLLLLPPGFHSPEKHLGGASSEGPTRMQLHVAEIQHIVLGDGARPLRSITHNPQGAPVAVAVLKAPPPTISLQAAWTSKHACVVQGMERTQMG